MKHPIKRTFLFLALIIAAWALVYGGVSAQDPTQITQNTPALPGHVSPSPATQPPSPVPSPEVTPAATASPSLSTPSPETPHATPTPTLPLQTAAGKTTVNSDNTLIKPVKQDGAPVIVCNRRLFAIYTSLGPYDPAQRAKFISDRLDNLCKSKTVELSHLKIIDGHSTTNIMVNSQNLVTISDKDAARENMTRQELARSYREIIQITFQETRQKDQMQRVVRGTIIGITAAVVLISVLMLLHNLMPLLYKKISTWEEKMINGLRIQKLEILSPRRMVSLTLLFVKGLRLVLTVGLLYSYFYFMFSFFPETTGLAGRIQKFINGFAHNLWIVFASYLPSLLIITVITIITRYVLRLIRFIVDEIKKGTITIPGFHDEWLGTTHKIVKFFVVAIALALAVPYFPGYNSPAFKGLSIFIGVIVSLGSTSLVANIIAGIVLTYTRAFRIGDRVKIGNSRGDVVEKTLLVTRIRTIKNVDISIPNATVLTNPIVNYSSSAVERGLVLHTDITIGYDVPWQKVHELLKYAAKATHHVQHQPEPFILQKSLDDFYVSYELNAYTDKPNLMSRIYSELRQNILDEFNKAGVEIMSPHYSSMRDGNQVAIPPENIPPEYTPPAFRLLSFMGKTGPPPDGQE